MTKHRIKEGADQDGAVEKPPAQVVLHEYFQSRIGRQKQTADATGILASTLSGMAHGRLPISMEAAVRLDVASEGALNAKELCPEDAAVLDKFVRLHACEVKAAT